VKKQCWKELRNCWCLWRLQGTRT